MIRFELNGMTEDQEKEADSLNAKAAELDEQGQQLAAAMDAALTDDQLSYVEVQQIRDGHREGRLALCDAELGLCDEMAALARQCGETAEQAVAAAEKAFATTEARIRRNLKSAGLDATGLRRTNPNLPERSAEIQETQAVRKSGDYGPAVAEIDAAKKDLANSNKLSQQIEAEQNRILEERRQFVRQLLNA